MKRAIAIFLAAALGCTAAHAAPMWWKGRSTAGATVLAGNGAGWSGITTTPAAQGSSGDYGYGDEAIARFDVVPYQTVAPGQTLHIGVVAFHQATVAEQTLGLAKPVAGSNIAKISVSVDGGTWGDATSAAFNQTTGVLEYNFDVRAADFPDGLHEARAIVYPTTGLPVVLQAHPRSFGVIGSISGTSLIIPDGTLQDGYLEAGQSVGGIGVSTGTHITGACTDDLTNTTCPVSPSQTVAVGTNLAIGQMAGLLFTTNGGGTLPSLVRYAGPTGADGTGCGATSAAPCLTINKALSNLSAAQIAAGGDAGGGTVCIQAGTYATGWQGAFSFSSAYASNRLLTFQASGHTPCDSVNAGAVTVQTYGAGSDNLGIKLFHLNYVNIAPTAVTGGIAQSNSGMLAAVWLDHGSFFGLSFSQAEVIHTSYFPRGIYCTDFTITNVVDGCDNAMIARNVTESYMASDAFQYAQMIINSTVSHDNPVPSPGDATIGSRVFRNFPGAVNVVVGECLYNATYFPDSTCVTSVDGPTQVTFNNAAIASGTQIDMASGINAASDQHPDIWQSTSFSFNKIGYGLDASAPSNLALGLNPSGYSGNWAVVNSKWSNDTTQGHVFQSGGSSGAPEPTKNWLWINNTWTGLLNFAFGPWTDVLVYRDTCNNAYSHPTGLSVVQSPSC